jgi:elongation factor 1 alpha-like protein
MRVLVQPGNHAGAVKSVEINNAAVEVALAGDTVDVALSALDAAAVSAGSMLCLPQWPVPLAMRFEARVVVLEVATPILKGRQVTCSGTTHLTEARWGVIRSC